MAHETLKLRNVGPIKEAEVEFGDLTVLVGPQATGKSLILQFLKLLLDSGPISNSLRRYGLDWGRDPKEFLDLYLGEGMGGIWTERSQLTWCGKPVDLAGFRRGRQKEKSFFIPAQRVLALSRDGWLRPFGDYRAGDPFAVRDFSEKLRIFLEQGLGSGDSIFPQQRRLKSEIRRLLDETVFCGFRLQVDKRGPQKRLVLRNGGEHSTLPFLVWSAGQREFVPLLLGLYWLMPPTKVSTRESIQWVMIEELEMGLHPRAIAVMLVIVLDLLWRGYRVCLSTHSPHVLDLVWALRVFRQERAEPENVLNLFDTKRTPPMVKLARDVLAKTSKVYYFNQETRAAHDISNLDPGSGLTGEAGWGGLTEFSGKIAEEVARVVAARGSSEV